MVVQQEMTDFVLEGFIQEIRLLLHRWAGRSRPRGPGVRRRPQSVPPRSCARIAPGPPPAAPGAGAEISSREDFPGRTRIPGKASRSDLPNPSETASPLMRDLFILQDEAVPRPKVFTRGKHCEREEHTRNQQ